MNIRRSLVTKYLLLIIASLLLWPVLPTLYYLPGLLSKPDSLHKIQELQEMWEHAADQLDKANQRTVNEKLERIQERYPKAKLFWVDETGETNFINKRVTAVPDQWTSFNVVNFLNRKKQHGLFTVVASIGKEGRQGFMVFLIPKSLTSLAVEPLFGNSVLVILMLFIGVSLVAVSLLFFFRIHKRLVGLRASITETGDSGIPAEVTVNNRDEIGQLEMAFNKMVHQLKDSRKREEEEEHLRKQLIANLSHDLRTPLTVIQQHAFTVQNNPSSPKATESMQIIINKLHAVGKLLENLLTYTLLSARRYPMEKTNTDVIEELRNAIAEWYPVFEKEGFEVDVTLTNQTLVWKVDPLWMRSILDNLFQNVIRHAKSGRYIGLETTVLDGRVHLVIRDKGRGMANNSEAKGAGIGLSIVSLMTKEMDIDWEMSSSSNGTCHYLGQI